MSTLSKAEREAVLRAATGVTTPRAKRTYPESIEQRLFVQRWRTDPRTRHLPACAIPNGARRGKAAAGIAKAEGMSKGAPDWLCFARGHSVPQPASQDRSPGRRPCIGLALEFKRPDGTGRPSIEQIEWHKDLRGVGWRVEIVTSAEQAWTVACDYLAIAP